jgi:hypothetical protein
MFFPSEHILFKMISWTYLNEKISALILLSYQTKNIYLERVERRLILKKGLILVLMVLITMVAAPAVQADTIFDLTSNHCSNPADCGAPGTIFGTVDLAQNGTTVDVTVSLNNPPYVWAKTGSADFQAFKFNATGVLLGDITVNQTFTGQTLTVQPGPFDGDGTGIFDFGIACTSCGNGISTISSDIIFHVYNATITDLTVANNYGITFVADIGNSTNGATGPIDGSPHTPPTVPEPAAVILLGSGLIGIWAARKKFKE